MFPFLKGKKPRTFSDVIGIIGTASFVGGKMLVWEHKQLDVKVLALEANNSELGPVLQYEVWIDGKLAQRFLASDIGLENADGLACAFAQGAVVAIYRRLFPNVKEFTDPPEPGTLFTFDGDGVLIDGEPAFQKGELLYGRSYGGKLCIQTTAGGRFTEAETIRKVFSSTTPRKKKS